MMCGEHNFDIQQKPGIIRFISFLLFMTVLFTRIFLIPGDVHSQEQVRADVPFAQFANSFLERHGLQREKGRYPSLPVVLDRCYTVVSLGLFEVRLPRYTLADKDAIEKYRIAVTALIDMQRAWLESIAEGRARTESLADLKSLRKWVRTWKRSLLIRAREYKEGKSAALMEAVKAKKNLIKAAFRLAEAMRWGIHFKRDDKAKGRGIPLFLSPNRDDFLALGSFMGTASDLNRSLLWQPGLALWTSFVRESNHVLALEHPSVMPGQGDITRGIPMNSREKTGLEQHVVQHGAEYLLSHYFGDAMPKAVANGFAMSWVIDLYGENNVRSGGGRRGRKTEAYSRFVAGGNSSGGRLAARNADTRWRQNKGKGFFLRELRAAQKKGGRMAAKTEGKQADRKAYFAIESEAGGGELRLVRTPFLTEESLHTTLSPEYEEDYLEFFRAYRCAFSHWLTGKAMGSKVGRLREDLLRKLFLSMAPGKSDKGLAESVKTIYGTDLAGLETEFLEWLSRKR